MNLPSARVRARRAAGPVAALTLALVLTGLHAPAVAQESQAATDVAERVTDAAAIAGEPAMAANSGVDIPTTGEGDITVAGDGQAGTLSIPASGPPVVADDGTRVFDGTEHDSSIAVQSTSSGARAVIDIESKDAPEAYTFELGGDIASLGLQPDGSVTVYDAAGTPTGQIAAPWAVDTTGTSVPTHYEVSGTTLTQIVEHKSGDYAYGIIADPRLTYGWGVYLNLTGSEMKALAAVTYTTGAVASILACELKGLPSVLGKVVKVLCIVVGGSSLVSIVKTLTNIAKSTAVTNAGCYQTKIIPVNRDFKRVNSDNCTG